MRWRFTSRARGSCVELEFRANVRLRFWRPLRIGPEFAAPALTATIYIMCLLTAYLTIKVLRLNTSKSPRAHNVSGLKVSISSREYKRGALGSSADQPSPRLPMCLVSLNTTITRGAAPSAGQSMCAFVLALLRFEVQPLAKLHPLSPSGLGLKGVECRQHGAFHDTTLSLFPGVSTLIQSFL